MSNMIMNSSSQAVSAKMNHDHSNNSNIGGGGGGGGGGIVPPSGASSGPGQNPTQNSVQANTCSSSSSNSNSVVHSQNCNEPQQRTVYVGNLDPSVTEDLLAALFGQIGIVNSVKIIHESIPFAFIEFNDHQSAQNAILTMHMRQCLGKEMRVSWASNTSKNSMKADTSKHYPIFIGDLSSEIDVEQIRDAFLPFGEISDIRIVKDPQTMKSKGYGFVTFVKKQDAENAIQTMNGQWLGTRVIKTNWATRKPPAARGGVMNMEQNSGTMPKQLTFDEVYQQSSPTNCTVYCGGIMNGLSEELIQSRFSPFGVIQDIRVFKDKGYAFIRFSTKEAATNAIVNMHNTDIHGQTIKCSWGKETGDPSLHNSIPSGAILPSGPAASIPGVGNPYNYAAYPYAWYAGNPSPSYPPVGTNIFAPPAVSTVTSVASQPGQVQYPYSINGQYYNTATGAIPGFPNAAIAMPTTMAWQANGSIAAQQPHIAANHSNLGPGIQQPQTMIGAYPMQAPYQAQ